MNPFAKYEGPQQRWLCTECKYRDVHMVKSGEWFHFCEKPPRPRKIRIDKYALGTEVLTPKWCPFLGKELINDPENG